MVTVSIIGIGRVGGALALSLPAEEFRVDTLVARRVEQAESIASRLASMPRVLPCSEFASIRSDIVLITTQDQHIAAVCRDLAKSFTYEPIVYHTSGSYPSTILSALADRGCETGSLHPLVSISSPELGPERFPGAYFCVEGSEKAVNTGLQIVRSLGGKPFSIDTRYKTLYHAAAVTACGHFVALMDAAIEIMSKCGISPDDAKTILMPLVRSTVDNLAEQGTADALTGTFARADTETLTRHLTALNENVSEDLLEIYLLLGERSLELAAKRGVANDRIESMRTKVAIAKSKLKW